MRPCTALAHTTTPPNNSPLHSHALGRPWGVVAAKPAATDNVTPRGLQRDIFDPSIGHDHVRGRIPIAVLVQARIKAVPVVIDNLDGLRELNFAIGSELNAPEGEIGHLLL